MLEWRGFYEIKYINSIYIQDQLHIHQLELDSVVFQSHNWVHYSSNHMEHLERMINNHLDWSTHVFVDDHRKGMKTTDNSEILLNTGNLTASKGESSANEAVETLQLWIVSNEKSRLCNMGIYCKQVTDVRSRSQGIIIKNKWISLLRK